MASVSLSEPTPAPTGERPPLRRHRLAASCISFKKGEGVFVVRMVFGILVLCGVIVLQEGWLKVLTGVADLSKTT